MLYGEQENAHKTFPHALHRFAKCELTDGRVQKLRKLVCKTQPLPSHAKSKSRREHICINAPALSLQTTHLRERPTVVPRGRSQLRMAGTSGAAPEGRAVKCTFLRSANGVIHNMQSSKQAKARHQHSTSKTSLRVARGVVSE